MSGQNDEMTAGAVLYAKDVDRVAAFYVEVAGLRVRKAEPAHVALESPGFDLVVVRIPETLARSITIESPPLRRESTPIKLVFPVAGVAAARAAAARLCGALNPEEREWRYEGGRVCDGHDPEGNVFQLRESGPR